VLVRFGDVEQTFVGDVEDVWLSVNRLFGEFVPSFNIAKRLVLSVDLKSLVKNCEGLIGFGREGPQVLVSRNALTDNESLLLWLLAAYVGFGLGLVAGDSVSRDELQFRLGKSGKIVGTRLGELVKGDLVVKLADDKYRISTFGVTQLQKELLPKIKAKVGG
jgi:hypothetical protein